MLANQALLEQQIQVLTARLTELEARLKEAKPLRVKAGQKR